MAVLRVEDRDGSILWRPAERREQVMDPEHAWLVTDMMRDVVRRGTAFTAVWGGGFRSAAAGKTGTTDDNTDAWYVGFTTEIVAGIWIGYDIVQRIMDNAGGGRTVAPAWTAFMRSVYERRPPPADWARPDSLITREVDRTTGFLATPFCPLELRHWDWFYPGTEPTRVCPVHSVFGPGFSP
jgi:membrane carboxypeptidase/penicillin-binding protein